MTRDPQFWLAVYGAGLSSVLALREWLKSRRHVKVSQSWATVPSAAGANHLYVVTVTNHGHRPVVIKMAGLMTVAGRQVIQPTNVLSAQWPLPKRLEDGESVDVYFDTAQLRAAIVEARARGETDRIVSAYARDSAGRLYTNALPVDFEDQVVTD